MKQRSAPRHGFTILEIMLALSIGSIVAAGATYGMVVVYQASLKIEKQAQVDEDAKLVLDGILSQLQQLGGGSMRPHSMLYMEDNADAACSNSLTIGSVTVPPCGGSDRLHYVVIEPEIPQCEIAGTGGVNVNFELSPECCDTDPGYESRTLILVDEETGQWQNRYCHEYQNAGSNCRCNFPPGQSGFNPPGGAGNDDFDITGAGYAATMYLDTTEHVLKVVADRNQDGNPEEYRLAGNVWDFQVTYIFDTDGDGEPDTEQTNYTGIADRSALRMIKVGLVIGARVSSRETPSTAQVLNGAVRTESSGYILRGVVGSTSLRNLFLFY